MGKLKLFVAGLALATTGVLGLGAPAGAADGAQGGMFVINNVWCC